MKDALTAAVATVARAFPSGNRLREKGQKESALVGAFLPFPRYFPGKNAAGKNLARIPRDRLRDGGRMRRAPAVSTRRRVTGIKNNCPLNYIPR